MERSEEVGGVICKSTFESSLPPTTTQHSKKKQKKQRFYPAELTQFYFGVILGFTGG
jgi:hypothetical protein